jgi:hypothetical protein
MNLWYYIISGDLIHVSVGYRTHHMFHMPVSLIKRLIRGQNTINISRFSEPSGVYDNPYPQRKIGTPWDIKTCGSLRL